MLQVIKGGRDSVALLPVDSRLPPSTIVRSLPKARPAAEEMLEIGLRDTGDDGMARSIVESYDAIQQFALKLADFYTHEFPAVSTKYRSMLGEVLDFATIGYLAHERLRDSRTQVAVFLANCIKGAANSQLAYAVNQQVNGGYQAWGPWEHGALAGWAHWGAEIEFTAVASSPPEHRYAVKGMLQQRLLRWTDVIAISRAGVDLNSLEMF